MRSRASSASADASARDCCSVSLLRTQYRNVREITGLRQALRTRDVIGQAKGILIARRGLTAGEAFDRLRQASQAFNIKLQEIAQTLSERPDRFL